MPDEFSRVDHDQGPPPIPVTTSDRHSVALRVRSIRPSEHDAAAELISSAYAAIDPAELAHLGSWGERPYSKVLRRVAERADAALVLVAVDGERLLGTVTYVGSHDNEWSEFEEEDAAGIRMLAVAPEAQGRGIARSLVAACLQQARADGKNRVILHTTWWMSAAQNLYQTMGFVQRRHAISRSPNPDTHPASRWRPSSMSFDLQNDPVK